MRLTDIPWGIALSIRRSSDRRREKLAVFGLYWYSILMFYFMFTPSTAQPREQQACPAHCRCVHIEGRLTADCSSGQLAGLPGPLPAGAMIVRLDNNPVGDAKWLQYPHYFVRIDRYAADWTELSMRSCNISNFRAELFWGLTNLNKLILARNKLEKIPAVAGTSATVSQEPMTPFKDMTKLKILDLSHNILTDLFRKNFKGAFNLEDIDLSFNEIKYLHNDAFSGLPKLRTIDLTGNKLSLVGRLVFSRLPNLKQLQLALNPFDCDCRLRDFVEWQRDKYIVQPPKCAVPEKLRDKPWNHLKLDEFACAPKLTPGSAGKKAVVNVGTSTVLQCRVSGIPEPRLIWEFHNATQTVVVQNTPSKYELKKTNVDGCLFFEETTARSSPVSCTSSHSLRIVKVGASDIGVYHCKATNPADTQYLVFQLDLDRGQIVQQVTGNGLAPGRFGSSAHESERIIKEMRDEEGESSGTALVPTEEVSSETSTSGDVLMVGLILGAAILVIIALLLAVLCYRRSATRNVLTGHARGNGGFQTASGSSFKPKAVNGYSYHIIDNGGPSATSPMSVGLCDASASISLRSPTSPAVLTGVGGVNPVEKPPRTHVENFYSDAPSASSSSVCEFHRKQLEQQRRQRQLDDSRVGLIPAEGDDSGFSDPESYLYQHQRSATLPYQRNQQPSPHLSTPSQRVLRPAIDDPLLEKKLLLTRRNSDGGSGFCVGHAHSAVSNDTDPTRKTLPTFTPCAYDKAELRETAL